MAEINYPNLIIVGAPKSGTSSLFNYLNQHPDIFMSDHKEPHFMIANDCKIIDYKPWVKSRKEYLNLFQQAGNYKIIGEGSVNYLTMAEQAIENIKKELPNEPKILILLRNPIDRAVSAYQHMKRSNPDEKRSFSQAISDSEENKTFNHPLMLYKTSGLYASNVEAYLTNFKHVKILIYDDFFKNVKENMADVWDFLDVSPYDGIEYSEKFNVKKFQWKSSKLQKLFIRPNKMKKVLTSCLPFLKNTKVKNFIRSRLTSKVNIEIESEDISSLIKFYTNDIKRLSKLLSMDLTYWIETENSK